MGSVALSMPVYSQEEKTEHKEQQLSLTEIHGHVYDAASGKPVAGITVQSGDDDRFVCMSNENGEFLLKAPSYITVLKCSGVSYAKQTVSFHGEDVVVRMYSSGFDRTIAPTSSLSVEDELAKRGTSTRVLSHAGVPAEGAAMFMNGFSSIFANSQPLIVVDGVILDRQLGRSLVHDGYFNNVLSAINVNDIADIQVLRNGTALYGAQGANGVIIIQTKRSKSMATRIDAGAWVGVESKPQLPDMMNSEQYRLYGTDLIGNSVSLPDFLNESTNDKQLYATYHNQTDWTRLVYRQAVTQNYNVNVQGGDLVANYNLSMGYTNAKSTLRNNDFSRLNLRFNTDINIISPLMVRLDVAFSNTTRDLRDDGLTSENMLSPGGLGLVKSPLLNPYTANKSGNITSTLSDADSFGLANPLSILINGEASNKNRLEYSLFTVSAQPEWRLSKHLVATDKITYVLNNVSERSFIPDEGVPSIETSSETATNNQAKANSYKQVSLQSDTRLTWQQRWGAHALKLFGGFRYLSDSFNADAIKADNSAGDKMPNITSNMSNRTVNGTIENWKSTTVYLNADWNYAQKYFLTAMASTATSTRFGKNAPGAIKIGKYAWGFFPGLQAMWAVSSENFMRHVTVFNYLHLNASIDVSGNDDINSYASRTYFKATPFLNQTSGLTLDNIGNDQLKWETTRKMMLGVDASMFSDRLRLAFYYYRSATSNLLVWKSLDGVGGIANYLSNDGKMKNQGFDLSFNIKALAMRNFSWSLFGSVSYYKNEVTSLPDNNPRILTKAWNGTILTEVGKPLGLFYGYETAGVFATSEEAAEANLHAETADGQTFAAGDMRFRDINGDHVINNEDQTVIGDPNPKVYGYFGTGMHYGKWQMEATFSYSWGNDIYNYQRAVLESGSNYFNQTTALLRRWTQEGQQTDIPKVTAGDPMGNSRFSDRWIEDGSYIKLKTVRLSYTQPLNLTWFQGFTLWASVNNLFTLTHYLGSDPEVSVSNLPLFQGIDRGLLGHGRSFVMGVNVNL